MKKKDKESDLNPWIAAVLIVILLVTMIYVVYTITSSEYFDKENIIVEGVVTNVVPVENKDGSIKYLNVTFNNNEIYNLKPTGLLHNDIDFTVNSKLIVELYWYPNQGEDFKYSGLCWSRVR